LMACSVNRERGAGNRRRAAHSRILTDKDVGVLLRPYLGGVESAGAAGGVVSAAGAGSVP